MDPEKTYATGRRKTSTARVYLTKGKGNILVNDIPLEEYFGREVAKILVMQPLVLLEIADKFDDRTLDKESFKQFYYKMIETKTY